MQLSNKDKFAKLRPCCQSLEKHLYFPREHSLIIMTEIQYKTMLLFLTETWKTAIDNGSTVGVIFVDFRKAFDTINHDMLEYKMIASGISGNLHNWIMNYLTGCKQYVEINGQKLEILIIEIGVPQESLLGPRLFAIYVNDLLNSSRIGYIHMFADDTTIYYIGNGVEDVITGLNLILEDFYIWCKKNRLIVHTGKTEAMIITKHLFTGPLQPILFAGNFIKVVEQSDCLGIKIHNRLCWKPHITASCKKFCLKLKFIRRIKGLPAMVLEEIYYKGIIPSITYCISIWGTCSPSLINGLEDVNICAGRIIHKLKPSVKDNEVLSKIGWSPLEYIYKRRLATIMHEVYHNKVHQKLGSLFENKRNKELFETKTTSVQYTLIMKQVETVYDTGARSFGINCRMISKR